MAKTKFEMSVRLAQAVGLTMEADPKDWDSAAQSACIRYLILACSDKEKASIGTVKQADGKEVRGLVLDGKLVTSCQVDLTLLREEFAKTAKLFETSNFKKTLAEGDYPQFKEDKKVADFA
jgi:hypothetical protein